MFQCACILYSEQHPEVVEHFGSKHAVAMDVVQSLVLVSLIFGIISKFETSAYEKKKKELDEANEQRKDYLDDNP